MIDVANIIPLHIVFVAMVSLTNEYPFSRFLGLIYMAWVPETNLLPELPQPRYPLTLRLFLCKIDQPFTLALRTRLRGRDNSSGRVFRLGNPGRRDNFSSYKRFDSPNWDNSRCDECLVMLKFRIYSRNTYQRSDN